MLQTLHIDKNARGDSFEYRDQDQETRPLKEVTEKGVDHYQLQVSAGTTTLIRSGKSVAEQRRFNERHRERLCILVGMIAVPEADGRTDHPTGNHYCWQFYRQIWLAFTKAEIASL